MDELQAHTGIQRMGEWGGIVNYGPGDNGMVVLFYLKGVLNQGKSTASGRPHFDDKVFVRIHPPGERLNIVEREATVQDKQRFPRQWAQFQQNKPQESNGTPIDLLFPAQPSIPAALKASGVFTVEQCSELSAHAIETIGMGAQHWSNNAKRYLEVANKGVKASQLAKIVEEKDREIHTLKHELDMLRTELNGVRDRQKEAVTMQDIQQMLAQQGGNGRRGVYVPGANFDPQSAQINALHPTVDAVKGRKATPAKPANPPKRMRNRLE